MQEFSGRTAVITGGASGIGLGLAEHCAQLGMNVVLGDIQKDALDQAVETVERRQADVIGVVTDTMMTVCDLLGRDPRKVRRAAVVASIKCESRV